MVSWQQLAARLLRGRIIICVIGLIVMCNKPDIAQWIMGLCGMAMGISAIDAYKGK